MSAGDVAKVAKYNSPVVALHTAGTTVRVATKAGDVEQLTISGLATERTQHLGSSGVSALWTDNTYIYIGKENGEVRRLTEVNLVNTKLAKFDCKVSALAVTGTTLYIGLVDGTVQTYALS